MNTNMNVASPVIAVGNEVTLTAWPKSMVWLVKEIVRVNGCTAFYVVNDDGQDREITVDDIREVVVSTAKIVPSIRKPSTKPLSENVAKFFDLLASDAPNWSGSPLLGGNVSLLGPKGDRGLLVHLKRAGLVTTFVDEGNTWINFTAAGINRATERNIYLGCTSPWGEEEAAAVARNEALPQ